ncbi:electron transport complex subunit RsxB [Pantoea sp. Aalb]|uniref:electron transport complex subunit RsxB n=1 Tax=Pantoea sp. Aalb TaxID=2576762 RepID=UPI001325994E|nr:electron transport complex subunit RsxB [Pantoea sp. Aalb]MXP67410.1 electron transport complex subunit RsxB [Pantoea sp. Aalb]
MNLMFISVVIFTILSLICGILLSYASIYFTVQQDPIIEQIDSILPQTQCGQCGYPGCRLYAEAIINNKEIINKCTPGGKETILKLATMLHIEIKPLLNINNNIEILNPVRTIAWINEINCIGCAKCSQVCPVDAIIGAKHITHTVLSEICTGCDLCIIKCPTNCIEKHQVANNIDNWNWIFKSI